MKNLVKKWKYWLEISKRMYHLNTVLYNQSIVTSNKEIFGISTTIDQLIIQDTEDKL